MQWKRTQPWLEKVRKFRYHQFLIRFHQRVTEMTEEKVWQLLAELVASQKKNGCATRQNFGLATFSIEDAVLEEALSRGVTVLQRRGDLIETFPVAA